MRPLMFLSALLLAAPAAAEEPADPAPTTRAERKQAKKAQRERQERLQQALGQAALEALPAEARAVTDALDTDPTCVSDDTTEEVQLVVEQARLVVEADAVDMAHAVRSLVDRYHKYVEAELMVCAEDRQRSEPG